MRDIIIECYYTNLPAEVASQVVDALRNGRAFGLRSNRTISIFDPANLRSIWMQPQNGRQANQVYRSQEQLQDAVKIALLSQKTFINPAQTLSFMRAFVLTHAEQKRKNLE